MKGCAFSGHRFIPHSHLLRLRALVARAVRYAYSEGYRDFYNGGAMGFDLLAAEVVLEMKRDLPDIRLCMLLPCMNQDEKWNAAQRDSYEFLLSNADEVEYVSEEYNESCMRERNFLLASRADILVAYVGHSRSGASQTVRMADSMGKTIYNLYPALEKSEVKS